MSTAQIPSPPAAIAGIVHLNGRHIVTVAEGGLVRLPITKVQRAWAI